MIIGYNEITNEGRDFVHSEVYTNACWPKSSDRQEIVLFNGGAIAIPFTHVKECHGWYRDNTCTCPKDDYDDD